MNFIDVEAILVIYGVICLIVILLNIFYIIFSKLEPYRIEYSLKIYLRSIKKYISRYKRGKTIGKLSALKIRASFRRTMPLISFDTLVSRMDGKEDIEKLYDIIRFNYKILYELTNDYLKESPLKTAYFLNILYKYNILSVRPDDEILTVISKFIYRPSIYVRYNAFLVILKYGDAQKVADAIQIINKSEGYNYEKILSIGLLKFGGDEDELIGILLSNFDSYKVWIQEAITNYASYAGENYKEQILKIMTNDSYSDQTRIFCIRYFGLYKYNTAYNYILSFASDKNNNKYEYKEMAIKTLAYYKCDETIDILKECLKSNNWNIKVSAAETLEKFGLKYSDLMDVFNYDDRYAKELMQYFLDIRKIRQQSNNEENDNGRGI